MAGKIKRPRYLHLTHRVWANKLILMTPVFQYIWMKRITVNQTTVFWQTSRRLFVLVLRSRASKNVLMPCFRATFTEEWIHFTDEILIGLKGMDKYHKIKFIGRGSEGTVNLYRRLSDDKIVILKQVPIDKMSKDEKNVTSNEVKVISVLRHPNVIEYHESFFEKNSIFIVMEYAPGGTLHDYLKMRNSLPENEAINLFTQIVLGVNHVHSRNILHRDLKTQNILLSKDKKVIKIGDFGISKALNSRSKAISLVGTPNYLSPELCEGQPYNKKSDIWALGCILYELLTSKKAFDAPNLSALIVKIMHGSIIFAEPCKPSKIACNLVQSLLQRDPSVRPSTEMILAHPALITVIPRLITLGSTLPSTQKAGKPSFRKSTEEGEKAPEDTEMCKNERNTNL